MTGTPTPVRVYWIVFAILLALTATTVLVAFVDLGPLNSLIALTIAVVKALLVALFFMRLRHTGPIVWIYAAAAVVWLLMLIGFPLSDVVSRGWTSFPGR